MAVKTLDEHIKKAFMDLGFTEDDIRNGCWLLERNDKPIAWICLHKFLERVAQVAGITFDEPKVFNLEPTELAIYVNGHKGDFSAWAIGEASQKNCKNDYRWAMAEKRAKDRVILKLLGVAGDMYSEEEADDFKKEAQAFEKDAIAEKTAKTKAINKAIKTQEEYVEPQPKKSLEERYNGAMSWLKGQTKETYANASKSYIDGVNAIYKELNDNGIAGLFENMTLELNRVTNIDDSIPY